MWYLRQGIAHRVARSFFSQNRFSGEVQRSEKKGAPQPKHAPACKKQNPALTGHIHSRKHIVPAYRPSFPLRAPILTVKTLSSPDGAAKQKSLSPSTAQRQRPSLTCESGVIPRPGTFEPCGHSFTSGLPIPVPCVDRAGSCIDFSCPRRSCECGGRHRPCGRSGCCSARALSRTASSIIRAGDYPTNSSRSFTNTRDGWMRDKLLRTTGTARMRQLVLNRDMDIRCRCRPALERRLGTCPTLGQRSTPAHRTLG